MRLKPICFIAARGGSKGIPRKNITMLNDKPLISYTINAALEADAMTDIVVSTDDTEIADIARAEMPNVVEKIINVYLDNRTDEELFIDTYKRIGMAPFKERVYAKVN